MDVWPTEPGGRRSGMGRLVIGLKGEVWYTPHYRPGTWTLIREGAAVAGMASNGAKGKWELLRSTPSDTDDPYVIAARRRLARWEDLGVARLDIGERPYLISQEDYL